MDIKQQLRRSQFILTYGPGAIIESPKGSRLIPSLNGLQNYCNNSFFEKFEIEDIRMSRLLDEKGVSVHLLSIPSSESVEEIEDNGPVMYSTVIFPAWHICYKRDPPILYYNIMTEEHCAAYDSELCMECDKENNPNVRFVRSCPDGHLDEVNWALEVHKKSDDICDDVEYYHWRVSGGTMADISIECPKCGKSVTMNQIYQNKRDCSGRLPENEELKGSQVCWTKAIRNKDCSEKMSVVQKQSSSLRLANTKTLLKIPKYDLPVMDSFLNDKLAGYLEAIEDTESDISKETLINKAYDWLKSKDHKKLVKYLEDNTIEDLLNEFNQVNNRDTRFKSAVNEEFLSLRSKTDKESANFSKYDFVPYKLKGLGYDFPLDVCPINKLTTVTAQISYQRKPHSKKNRKTDEILEPEKVSVGYLDESTNKKWFLAFEGVGEGIFITSDENPLEYIGGLEAIVKQWENANVSTSDERPEVTSPLFVWWHTLAHAIIKSLSLSCGYVSASLHERVYVDLKTGKGGILIYNTSPGDDSGMGGLVDVVLNKNEFNKVLNNAMNSLLFCSNDPLCSSVELENGGVNGSACHNCLLISETSCEHQNTLLDRHFFI